MEKRIEAIRIATGSLSKHAKRLRGRYVLYGRSVRNDASYSGDIELLLDFPASTEVDAWHAAEDVLGVLDLPFSIMPLTWAKSELAARIRLEGRILS